MKCERKGKSTLKRLFKGKTVAFIILLFVVMIRVDYPSAQCEHLEGRIKLLEERIKELEAKLNISYDSLGSDQPASDSNEEVKYDHYKDRPLQETKQISDKRVVTKKELLSNFIKSRVLEKGRNGNRNTAFRLIHDLSQNCKAPQKVSREIKQRWSGYLIIDGDRCWLTVKILP